MTDDLKRLMKNLNDVIEVGSGNAEGVATILAKSEAKANAATVILPKWMLDEFYMVIMVYMTIIGEGEKCLLNLGTYVHIQEGTMSWISLVDALEFYLKKHDRQQEAKVRSGESEGAYYLYQDMVGTGIMKMLYAEALQRDTLDYHLTIPPLDSAVRLLKPLPLGVAEMNLLLHHQTSTVVDAPDGYLKKLLSHLRYVNHDNNTMLNGEVIRWTEARLNVGRFVSSGGRLDDDD